MQLLNTTSCMPGATSASHVCVFRKKLQEAEKKEQDFFKSNTFLKKIAHFREKLQAIIV